MIKDRQLFFLFCVSFALLGCSSSANTPLIFLQAHTLGISANASSQSTPELTLGFRDLDVAIVPVSDANGQPIRSVQKGQYKDALSVFGQFEATTESGALPNAGLGKFFATGTAAAHLAQGFQHKLCGANCPQSQ